jgi:TolB-like protein
VQARLLYGLKISFYLSSQEAGRLGKCGFRRLNMRKFFLFVFLAFSFSVYADMQYGILKGRIFDSKTKEGIGGIQLIVSGKTGRYQAVTDDFGNFSLKLAPGEYITEIQEIPQKIGFVILPSKTALLDIPLTAQTLPQNTPIPYRVSYSPQNQEGQNPNQAVLPGEVQPQKKGVPFVPGNSQNNGQTNPGNVTSTPQGNTMSSNPNTPFSLKTLIIPQKNGEQTSSRLPTLAIVPFKDSTGHGLGEIVSEDLAGHLFDLGKVMVVGPDSVSAAIGGEPADPLNEAFGTWVSKKLGADYVVLGRIKEAHIDHHQYLLIVTAQGVLTATVVIMNSKNGTILTTITETGSSGIMGMSGNKDRYYEDKTIAELFQKASMDLVDKLSKHILEAIGEKSQVP